MTTLEKAGMLALLPQMKKIDAMQCSLAFREAYGIRLDWHEFAAYLDELHTKDLIRIWQHGEMTEYILVIK